MGFFVEIILCGLVRFGEGGLPLPRGDDPLLVELVVFGIRRYSIAELPVE